MFIDHKRVPLVKLVENGQKTQSHYIIVNVEGEEIVPLTDIFKCRDYIHDAVWYKYTKIPFLIYGFDNKVTKDWTGEHIAFVYGIIKGPKVLLSGNSILQPHQAKEIFDRRVETANTFLELRGMPLIEYQYVTFDEKLTSRGAALKNSGDCPLGTNTILVDTTKWAKSTLHISILTGILRMCCYSEEQMPNIHPDTLLKNVKSETPALLLIVDDYLWSVMGEPIKQLADQLSTTVKGLEMINALAEHSRKDLVHNTSGIYSLFSQVAAFGFMSRYRYYRGEEDLTDEEMQMPIKVCQLNMLKGELNNPSRSVQHMQTNEIVRAQCLWNAYTIAPKEYIKEETLAAIKKACANKPDFVGLEVVV